MKTLNLARKEYSQIEYSIINFPDGQKHIRIESNFDHKESIRVVCRITNGDDLFILMQVADILDRHCLRWDLEIKYLLAARTDRLFSMGEAHSLNIVMRIINSLSAERVSIFEMHNYHAVCNQTSKQINYDFQNTYSPFVKNLSNRIMAYPDEGALHRYDCFVDDRPHIQCRKSRNPKTGELTNFEIYYDPKVSNPDILLVDDLCDGGGTFLGLESLLRSLCPKSLTLQVAHAIQLQGIEKVAKVYDKVIITNSYADWDIVLLPKNVEVIDVLR